MYLITVVRITVSNSRREERGSPCFAEPATTLTSKSARSRTKSEPFEGKCDDLSGYIYGCADPKQAADMYTNTTKEISEYVGRTYKYGGEMRQVIMKL